MDMADTHQDETTNTSDELTRAVEADLRGARPLNEPSVPEAPRPAVHDPAHEGHIDADLPRLKTFADDLSDEMKRKGTTLASIVTDERERAGRAVLSDAEEDPWYRRNFNNILLVGSVFIGVAAILALAVGVYVSFIADDSTPTPTPSIIYPNRVAAFTVPDYDTVVGALASERSRALLALGEIERIDLSLEGVTTTPQDLIAELAPPPGLVRETRSVMFGIHSFNRNQPFIILEVTQYDRAFGAMLAWEEDMGRSLDAFFKPHGGTVPPTTLFTDRVFENLDLRVSQTAWPIIYTFPRRDVLVITTNEQTLREVLTRLNAQQGAPVLP
jgi:hypothetical protein